LQGTFQPCRRYKDEPTPRVDIPDKPTFLKGEAAKEWNRITPLLAAQKCLTEWDRSLIAAYCFEWGVYVQLCKTVKIEDISLETILGNRMANPLFNARNKALKNMKEIATEFGLTPSSRTRLSVSEAEKENPFEKLLRQNVG